MSCVETKLLFCWKILGIEQPAPVFVMPSRSTDVNTARHDLARTLVHFGTFENIPRSLFFQYSFLSLEAPAIAAQALIFTNDSVTWNHQRYRVRGTRSGDRSHRLWLAHCTGNLRIRFRLTVRYGAEVFPNLPLKRRRSNVQRQIESRLLTFKVIQ